MIQDTTSSSFKSAPRTPSRRFESIKQGRGEKKTVMTEERQIVSAVSVWVTAKSWLWAAQSFHEQSWPGLGRNEGGVGWQRVGFHVELGVPGLGRAGAWAWPGRGQGSSFWNDQRPALPLLLSTPHWLPLFYFSLPVFAQNILPSHLHLLRPCLAFEVPPRKNSLPFPPHWASLQPLPSLPSATLALSLPPWGGWRELPKASRRSYHLLLTTVQWEPLHGNKFQTLLWSQGQVKVSRGLKLIPLEREAFIKVQHAYRKTYVISIWLDEFPQIEHTHVNQPPAQQSAQHQHPRCLPDAPFQLLTIP